MDSFLAPALPILWCYPGKEASLAFILIYAKPQTINKVGDSLFPMNLNPNSILSSILPKAALFARMGL